MPEHSQAHVGEVLDLTQSQLMIWAGHQLQRDDPLYNMAFAFEIDGKIDVDCFNRAFGQLVDQNDVLRLVIRVEQEIPKQAVLADFPYEVEFVDFSLQNDARRAFDEWVQERVRRSFDLAGCLFDSVLLKLNGDRFVWYFAQHHLACDAWSMELLFRRQQELYGRVRRGEFGRAPAVPAFRHYLSIERESSTSPGFQRAIDFWQDKLRRALKSSSFYREVPVQRSGRTDRHTCELGIGRSERLKAMAVADAFRAFTPDLAQFHIFATTLFAYLSRITGNTRLAIGTPTHNRVSQTLRETAGLFIEMYPLQVEVEVGDSFRALHGKVVQATQQMMMHIAPGVSGVGHNRAYDVVLNYITASFGDFDGLPVAINWVHPGYGDRDHLLRIQVHSFGRDNAFTVHFDMNVDAFVDEEKARLVGHYLELLDEFLRNPDRRIAEVPLLSGTQHTVAGQSSQITAHWETPVLTVVDHFLARVCESPASTALYCNGAEVSYVSLNDMANKVAACLAGQGVLKGHRVGICLHRSVDAVAAILGILKAGAAYVPIDPDYPAHRVRLILGDAAISCVFTQPETAAAIPEGRVHGVDIGRILAGSVAADEPPPEARAHPSDTCYLIYTSGSTGSPKGVVINHGGVSNYIQWAVEYYLQGETLDFPLFSTLGFDLTVTSLFVPLVTGARLVVYPEDPARREVMIQRVIEDDQVQAIKLTPAHLALLQTVDLSLSRVRKLIVGGEDFKTGLARAVTRRFGRPIEIYNEYGPTEGTVACMVHRFDADRDNEASVPIGLPISGVAIRLLDSERMPVPQGAVGEIHISGLGVADGYLNAAELNRERFVDNPWLVDERLYATGDLGRWGDDGIMRFLGRRDHQVKVRGVRIELAEIESAMLALDGVKACVVAVNERSDPAQDLESEAYCRVCGLSGRHPDARLDGQGVCGICRSYEASPDMAHGYFGTMDDLRAIIARANAGRRGKYDSLALLSGGKDSSYALCRMVEMGLRPLVFTLDNGFIAEGAKANIRRLTQSLGLDLHVATTEAMNAIFVDSLNRHSNVCNGCFKAIYTMSMHLAHKLGLRYITTGLSRGQIFETRLADLFRHNIFDPQQIDRMIIEARKAYHRQDDVIARELGGAIFEDDAVFDEIEFVDFYRYCDVSLDEIYSYLDTQVGWIRPADTGRSTNCLINEVGIYVHKAEQGYHNYSLPYSWDVRLGHKQRDAARAELDDNIDSGNVKRILAEIGYEGDAAAQFSVEDRRLVAYYVADREISASDLKSALAVRLPEAFVPSFFVPLAALPLTPNGKIDRDGLPSVSPVSRDHSQAYVAPRGEIEERIASIWGAVIGVEKVGRHDNFFDLGGDSILNIQIVSQAKKIGLSITPQQVFEYPTVADLAGVVGKTGHVEAEQGIVQGRVPLTPIQRRFFEHEREGLHTCTQSVLLSVPHGFNRETLASAIPVLLRQHDGLRAEFSRRQGSWVQEIPPVTGEFDASAYLVSENLAGVSMAQQQSRIAERRRELGAAMRLDQGPLIRMAYFDRDGARDQMLIVAHHLLVDGVSWWILLEDLQSVCDRVLAGEIPATWTKTTSIRAWSEALGSYARSAALRDELPFWIGNSAVKGELPVDIDVGENDWSSAETLSVSMSEAESTQLIHEVPAAYSTQVGDLLLTALTRTLCEWSGQQDLFLDLEGHGREEVVPGVDLLRTVGWFTSVYPIRLHDAGGLEIGSLLTAVKEQLRTVPNRGIGYGVLRYLSGDGDGLEGLGRQPERQVLFNYLGQWGEADENPHTLNLAQPIMADHGEQGLRHYLVEINAVMFAGRLVVDWTYSRNRHERGTIESLAQGFIATLRSLISHCLGTEDTGLSPSDFPQADLDQGGLDELLAEFGED